MGQPLHGHDAQAQPAAIEQQDGQLAAPLPRLPQAVEGVDGKGNLARSEGGWLGWHGTPPDATNRNMSLARASGLEGVAQPTGNRVKAYGG